MNRQGGSGSSNTRVFPTASLLLACGYLLIAPNLGVWYSTQRSYDIQRGMQIAILGLLAVGFAGWPRLFRTAASRLPAAALAIGGGILVLGLISAAVAARPLYALREVALFALLAVFVFAVAEAARALGEQFDRVLAHALMIAVLFYLTLFLSIRYLDSTGYSTSHFFELPSFFYPRFFAQFQTWTLPLVVLPLLCWNEERPSRYAVMGVAAAGWWMLFFISGARGTILATVLGAALVTVLFHRHAWRWLAASAGSATLGFVGYLLIAPRSDAPTALAEAIARGGTDNGRFPLWHHALGNIADSPVLGLGPGHLAYWGVKPPLPHAHPHNAAIQWAAEWGLLASALAFALLAWGAWRWVAARRREPDGSAPTSLIIALTAALAAASVHALLSGVIVMPVSQTVGAVVVGWALGIHWRSGGDARGLESRAFLDWPVRLTLVAAAALLLWTSALPSVSPEIAGHRPRYWGNGNFP